MWGIRLDRESELPLRRQIYQSLRDQITGGYLNAGEHLPSTRELSGALNVARSTVSEAYDMLIAEGFVISSQGAPTKVAEGLVMERENEQRASEETSPEQRYQADFRTGRPDLRLFPRYLWQQMVNKASEELTTDQYGYTGAQGISELRMEIAGWLFRSRGITVDPVDLFITQGATHALHLIAELISGEDREILMEDPCHTGMLHTFLDNGCRIEPVPADMHGIRTELLSHINARAIYITPSHQFPLGGILPASRRAALLRIAHDNDAYLIEDDYDSEFRYCGEPIAPLYSMDPRRVIYVGTFSKTLYPGLRIGYVILPRELQKQWIRLRTYTDVQNPILEQKALALLLRSRKIDKHIQKMRRVYGERRQVLLASISRSFERDWTVYGDDAGLHLALEFPGLNFNEAYRKSALEKGINITPVEYHCIEKGRHSNKLLIGYGHLDPQEIRDGIVLLHDHMETYFG